MNRCWLLLLPLCLSVPVAAEDLSINELLASNESGIVDEDGDNSDWVEIFNSGESALSLEGYGLTDDPGEPFKWIFPNVQIEPGGYLLVWPSGKNRTGSHLHASFRLDAKGEYVGLYTPDGLLVDGVFFGQQVADLSYGRIPDGGSEWGRFPTPTPGASNLTRTQAPSPVLSLSGGFFEATQTLEISSDLAGAVIWFTTDASLPSLGSTGYSVPIVLRETTIVRARVFSASHEPSPVVTATYLFGTPGDLPAISVVTEPANLWDASTGIYANPLERGPEWERPASFEFFPSGAENLQVDCGLRIHGGRSRKDDKKSFRLHFTSTYGLSKMENCFFEDPQIGPFDWLVLSSSGNDAVTHPETTYSSVWTLLRDTVMNRLFEETGTPVINRTPARLYLNGEPWGIYWIKERIDDSFVESRYGFPDFDLLRPEYFEMIAVEGDTNRWNEMDRFLENNSFEGRDNYLAAQYLLDIENLIDHYIIEMWGGNADWPHSNTYQVRPRVPNGIWRWIPWDSDFVMGSPTWMSAETDLYSHVNGEHIIGPQYNWSTLYFRKLVENAEFQIQFANRVADLLNSTLRSDNVTQAINEEAARIRSEISFETDRWGSSLQEWERNVSRMVGFAEQRDDYFRVHTRRFFQLQKVFSLTIEEPEGEGSVRVNRLDIPSFPWTGDYFRGLPLPLSALPAPGYTFARWEGAELPSEASVTLVASSNVTLKAIFEPLTTTPQPNDVIINEYWNNDNGTAYESIEGRPIEGDWIELLVAQKGGADLRNWRLTNNPTKNEKNPENRESGSILFPALPQLANLPHRTAVLVIMDTDKGNPAYFDRDDLDPSDGRLVFSVGNGNLDTTTDTGFNIRRTSDALVLLAPGPTADFADDIGIDFIAESHAVTPHTFGVDAEGVVFHNPFEGIGDDDGAVFVRGTDERFDNNNGEDRQKDDQPGPGGWIVDPPGLYTGDDPLTPDAQMILSPGRLNPGQEFSPFDLDRTGEVNDADLLGLLAEYKDPGDPLQGDFNDSGEMDPGDLFLFSSEYRQ